MKRLLLSGVAAIALPGMAFANCPAITVADMGGVAAGAYPQQYDSAEFEAAADILGTAMGAPNWSTATNVYMASLHKLCSPER